MGAILPKIRLPRYPRGGSPSQVVRRGGLGLPDAHLAVFGPIPSALAPSRWGARGHGRFRCERPAYGHGQSPAGLREAPRRLVRYRGVRQEDGGTVGSREPRPPLMRARSQKGWTRPQALATQGLRAGRGRLSPVGPEHVRGRQGSGGRGLQTHGGVDGQESREDPASSVVEVPDPLASGPSLNGRTGGARCVLAGPAELLQVSEGDDLVWHWFGGRAGLRPRYWGLGPGDSLAAVGE